jgi:hypothetical protein
MLVKISHKKYFSKSLGRQRREILPGSTTNLGEGEEHTPHLTLVAETILANELQLGVPEIPKVSPRSQST